MISTSEKNKTLTNVSKCGFRALYLGNQAWPSSYGRFTDFLYICVWIKVSILVSLFSSNSHLSDSPLVGYEPCQVFLHNVFRRQTKLSPVVYTVSI